jgi:alkaline phosphatase
MKMQNLLIILIALTVSVMAGPKNTIIMISDGCGYYQVDAASLFRHGETGMLVFESFPVQFAMSTHPADGTVYDPDSAWVSFDYVTRKPTDSAASGTALACGEKTNNGMLGYDPEGTLLETVMERSEKIGRMTGAVTSLQLSHATPASFVIHNMSRQNYEEIARDMFMNSATDVIMGCGNPYYDEDGNVTKLLEFKYVGGRETWKELEDGEIGGDADGDGKPDPWTLIQEREEFQRMMSGETPKRVIGIPEVRTTLQQKRSGDENAAPFEVPLHESIPTLEEMSMAAINVLSSDPDGFTLMIEGGAVDWAGHANQAGRIIEEELAFTDAVKAVIDWVEANSSWDETLLIVTADHETGYLTGPGSGAAETPVWNPLTNKGKGAVPGMEWHSGGHTNSLVPLYAKGEGSELFEKYAKKEDPVRGKYLDNTDVARVFFKLNKD